MIAVVIRVWEKNVVVTETSYKVLEVSHFSARRWLKLLQ